MFKDILIDTLENTKACVNENIYKVAVIINFALPYFMFYIASQNVSLTWWLILPIVVFITTYIMRQYANRVGQGASIPVPDKRFTECHNDGQVDVDYARIQEMILYMGKLEDWLKKNGLEKKEVKDGKLSNIARSERSKSEQPNTTTTRNHKQS